MPLEQQGGALLPHHFVHFKDAVVFASGNGFVDCNFDHCTIVVHDATSLFDGCTFNSCTCRIECTVHDAPSAERVKALIKLFEPHLPKPAK